MAYVSLTGKVAGFDENTYTIQSTGEQRSKVQVTLELPSMRDKVLCEFDLEHAPATELLDRWELEESWIIISANSFRSIGFNRKNPRANEKAIGSMVVFQATEAHEASPEERKALQEARKAARLASRQRRQSREAA